MEEQPRSTLHRKILGVIFLTSMIPMIALTVFTYKMFDVSYTNLLHTRYSDAVEGLTRQLDFVESYGGSDQSIEEIVAQYKLFDQGYLEIMDGDGNILYAQKQKQVRLDQSIAANIEQLHFEKTMQSLGWKISFTVSKVAVQSDLYVLRGLQILVILCSGAAICIAASRLAHTITDPLGDMMEQMNRMERGELHVNIAVDSNDEIGVLAKRFNKMSSELQNYINRCYVAQINEKEAELNALKSQVAPHFLNNTLEAIRMMAVDENAPKSAEMIEALSQQMRYTIGTARDLVPLKLEIAFIRQYILLMNYRYEDCARLEIEDFGMGEAMIPKLSIQPLVENAFKYGIKPKGKPGVILITVECNDGDIEITVMDDGLGMPPDRVKKLMKALEQESPGVIENYNWKGTGLKNVHDRLRMLYGQPYGVTMTSREGVGTAVCIRIPGDLKEISHVDDDSRG